jgi:hypothetical protein
MHQIRVYGFMDWNSGFRAPSLCTFQNVLFRLLEMILLHLVIVKYILLHYLATASCVTVRLVAVTVPD